MRECGHAGGEGQAGCAACDRREIPADASPGRRTPTFDATSVPPALLDSHLARAWAELVVLTGRVRFVEEGSGWEAVATPQRPVVIVPERPHHIQPSADATFYVQFHDLSG